jgi:hypothetical protein
MSENNGFSKYSFEALVQKRKTRDANKKFIGTVSIQTFNSYGNCFFM